MEAAEPFSGLVSPKTSLLPYFVGQKTTKPSPDSGEGKLDVTCRFRSR